MRPETKQELADVRPVIQPLSQSPARREELMVRIHTEKITHSPKRENWGTGSSGLSCVCSVNLCADISTPVASDCDNKGPSKRCLNEKKVIQLLSGPQANVTHLYERKPGQRCLRSQAPRKMTWGHRGERWHWPSLDSLLRSKPPTLRSTTEAQNSEKSCFHFSHPMWGIFLMANIAK